MEDWRPIAEAVTTFYLLGDPATSEWSEQFFDACWIMVPAAT
jgi:hypothetical protein